MKKITFVLTLLSAMFYNANLSEAENFNYVPYVGIEYVYNHTTARGISPKYSVGGFYIGSEYNRYFSTEMFFNQSSARKNYPLGDKVKTSYRSYGLDLIGYLPLGCAKRFSLLGTAGFGEYVYKIKEYPEKHGNEHGWSYRFGGGFKYALNNHWQTRVMARYIHFDGVENFDHAVEYSIGAEYHF